MGKHCLLACSQDPTQLPSHMPTITCLGMVLPKVGWALLHSTLSNQENAPRDRTAHLVEGHLTPPFQMCQGDTKHSYQGPTGNLNVGPKWVATGPLNY